MQRELKFRLWDTNEKHFVDPKYIAVKGNGEIMADTGKEWVDGLDQWDFLISQYTGLQDKNGKEIYEGDILSTNLKTKAEVFFDKGMFKCKVGEKHDESFELINVNSITEVMGNIYENPELIKKP